MEEKAKSNSNISDKKVTNMNKAEQKNGGEQLVGVSLEQDPNESV